MKLDGRGVVIAGASGSGKTTLTGELRKLSAMQIVNDDWGPMDLRSRQALFTEEPMIHMKYPSVRTLLPSAQISPETNASENFSGNIADPKARLLIRREEVFGPNGVVDSARIDCFVVVTRDVSAPMSVRRLTIADLPFLARGGYSDYYKREEPFLNGSLFLASRDLKEQQMAIHERLLQGSLCVAVNNNGSPCDVARLILRIVENETPRS